MAYEHKYFTCTYCDRSNQDHEIKVFTQEFSDGSTVTTRSCGCNWDGSENSYHFCHNCGEHVWEE